jgi:hypothetical protein
MKIAINKHLLLEGILDTTGNFIQNLNPFASTPKTYSASFSYNTDGSIVSNELSKNPVVQNYFQQKLGTADRPDLNRIAHINHMDAKQVIDNDILDPSITPANRQQFHYRYIPIHTSRDGSVKALDTYTNSVVSIQGTPPDGPTAGQPIIKPININTENNF